MLLRSMLLALALGTASCATRARSLPVTAQDNTAALISHPEFLKAAHAAPLWTDAALKTITRLEKELANAGQ